MTLRSIWPLTLCAALTGMAAAAGCLGEPRDEPGTDVESSAESDVLVCGPVCGVCGNGICEPGELRACPRDCMLSQCGNGLCDPPETLQSCPADCGLVTFCGDGVCSGLETHQSCPADCP